MLAAPTSRTKMAEEFAPKSIEYVTEEIVWGISPPCIKGSGVRISLHRLRI